MSAAKKRTTAADEIDAAIGLIYEAGLGEGSWNDALSALGAPFSGGVYCVVWDSLAQRPLFEAVSLHGRRRRRGGAIHMPKALCGPGMRVRDLAGRLVGHRPFERPWIASRSEDV